MLGARADLPVAHVGALPVAAREDGDDDRDDCGHDDADADAPQHRVDVGRLHERAAGRASGKHDAVDDPGHDADDEADPGHLLLLGHGVLLLIDADVKNC